MKETNITVLMVEPGKNPVVTTIKSGKLPLPRSFFIKQRFINPMDEMKLFLIPLKAA